MNLFDLAKYYADCGVNGFLTGRFVSKIPVPICSAFYESYMAVKASFPLVPPIIAVGFRAIATVGHRTPAPRLIATGVQKHPSTFIALANFHLSQLIGGEQIRRRPDDAQQWIIQRLGVARESPLITPFFMDDSCAGWGIH